MIKHETRKVNELIWRDKLYPRIKTCPTTVQKYAEDLEILPPVEINQRNEIIDGWHRWTAHKKQEAETIKVIITETESDEELLELAIARNATHGLQLSQADKKDIARKIYHATSEKDRDAKKKQLAKILSVSDRTIREWLSRIDKDAKEARDKRIFDLWLACWTQEAIAEECGCDKATVNRRIDDLLQNGELSSLQQTHTAHLTDFEPPLYNIWKFKEKSEGQSHYGNSEKTILDNLLYFYTQPLDVVVDPFAGGGSTIDICAKRRRRYWVSDRKPVVEREAEIRKLDITLDLPKPPRWEDVKLVYLDPPYWKQAEGKYSKDDSDLANMPLELFNATLSGFINKVSKKLKPGAFIALLIQPTQWKSPDKKFVDHVADMINAIKLPINMRISCPYESQQCTAQMVKWAKENKKLLVLTRELIVWEIV